MSRPLHPNADKAPFSLGLFLVCCQTPFTGCHSHNVSVAVVIVHERLVRVCVCVYVCVCACMCVCVLVGEREREGERDGCFGVADGCRNKMISPYSSKMRPLRRVARIFYGMLDVHY